MVRARKAHGLSRQQKSDLNSDVLEQDDVRDRRAHQLEDFDDLDPTLPKGFVDEEIDSDDEDVDLGAWKKRHKPGNQKPKAKAPRGKASRQQRNQPAGSWGSP